MADLTDEQRIAAAAFTDGLRSLAEWLDEHPDYAAGLASLGRTFDLPVWTKEELADAARAFGKATKKIVGPFFTVVKDFGGGVTLEAYTGREKVCRKIVTGTREVPAQTIPAHTEEIIDWVCDEPLLRSVPDEQVA